MSGEDLGLGGTGQGAGGAMPAAPQLGGFIGGEARGAWGSLSHVFSENRAPGNAARRDGGLPGAAKLLRLAPCQRAAEPGAGAVLALIHRAQPEPEMILPRTNELQTDPGAGLALRIAALRQKKISCASLAATAIRAFGIRGAQAAALGDIASAADLSGQDNEYHNPAHTRDVVTSWITLAATHRHLHANGRHPRALPDDAIPLGLMAAFGHDLLHDGQTNYLPGKSRWCRFRLERIAADQVQAIMARHGLAQASIATVRAAILGTDVLDGYSALRNTGPGRGDGAAAQDDGLQALADRQAWLIAVMLRDADIMTSAGLTAAEHDYQSALLGAEQEIDCASPAAAARFFERTMRGGFFSPAGQMFKPRLTALRALNRLRAGMSAPCGLAAVAARLAG